MFDFPLRHQSFTYIREKHSIYVDKTEYIYHIIQDPKPCLLARPPLFGMSLFVGALVDLLAGKRELFKALWIDQSGYDFRPRPYVYLDFNNLVDIELNFLKTALSKLIAEAALDKGIKLKNKSEPSLSINHLIAELYRQNDQDQVAVIIENYDIAVLNLMIKNQNSAAEAWEFLRDFFQILRLNDLTGLIFFTGHGYLDFGHLKDRPEVIDLSFDPRFATSCGFTELELRTNFADQFNLALNKLIEDEIILPSATIADLVKLLNLCFGGHTWNGPDSLLNPYSTIEFFKKNAFQNNWSPKANRALANHLTKCPLNLFKILSKEAYLCPISGPHKLEDLKPELLMFQFGDLSSEGHFSNELGNGAKLYFSNLEVKYSLLPGLLGLTAPKIPMLEVQAMGQGFRKALFDGDHSKMEEIYRDLASISPSKNTKNIFNYEKKLIFYLLAISGQSLKPIDLEPFDFALSGHESQDLEFEGHYILIDLRFLNNPKKEIAQVEEEYPAGTLKTAIQKILCPTAISSKSITLTACSILKGDSLSEIKVIFKKL